MKIEYENSDIVIINKPAGLPVYSAKSHVGEESVLSWALERYPEIKKVGLPATGLSQGRWQAGDPDRPGIVHRLDKQTSGLLVLAKNQGAFDYLKKLFQSRNISKEYQALVYGEMPKHGVIDKPLTKIGHDGQSRVRVDEAGKASVTEYWSLEQYSLTPHLSPPTLGGGMGTGSFFPLQKGSRSYDSLPLVGRVREGGVDEFTLVKVKLHTGRTHQIRVHFSSEKHPVMGDDLYGKPNSQKLSNILPRQFLHASRLELQLPDKTWLEVESELPEDLKKVLANLESRS